MLNIKIRTTNFDLTPAIDEYVSKKISILQKFLDEKNKSQNDLLCQVELGKSTNHHKSGDIFRAEINIMLPGQKQIFAVAEESDLYAAIDVVRDEAEREIVSAKEKRATLFRRGGKRIKDLLKRIRIGRT